MNISKAFGLFIIITSLLGCTNDNVITKEEIIKQDKSTGIVAGILFDNNLDELVSYNIRKDGFVVIQFDSSVSKNKYTNVVNQIRSNRAITGVWAEQSGVDVCPLR